WLNLLAQWLHLLAVGVWVGGLAWLLLGIGGSRQRSGGVPLIQGGSGELTERRGGHPQDQGERERPERVEAVRRFSRMAGGTGQAKPAAPPAVETSGNDYATTVRVKLVATPGTPGPNGFRATVVDYDSGKPVPAQRVQLRFSLPTRPDLGESTLDLARGGDGSWSGRGGPLAAQGRWDVSAVVQAPGSAVTVPMQLQTRTPPQQ